MDDFNLSFSFSETSYKETCKVNENKCHSSDSERDSNLTLNTFQHYAAIHLIWKDRQVILKTNDEIFSKLDLICKLINEIEKDGSFNLILSKSHDKMYIKVEKSMYSPCDDNLKSLKQFENINENKSPNKEILKIKSIHVEYAVKGNNEEVIKCLIAANCEINYIKCIKLAIEYKYKGMQKILINACPNLFEFDEDNNSLLHHAATFGHIELIELLIKDNEGFIYNKNSMGQQAQHCIGIDNIKIGELLIKKYINIDTFDINKWTPLHYFVFNNQIELAKFVINEGASIDAKNSFEESPLHMACTKGCYEMVKLLIDGNAKINKTETGERHSNREILTPLMASIVSGNFDMDIVTLLLDKKVDTTTKVFGRTALHFAILTENEQVIEALIDEGNSLDIKDADERTPLDLANKVFGENHIIIKLILLKKAEAKKAKGNKNKKKKNL